MRKSPYIVDDRRLADVIAAIQAMGTYKYYKLDFKGWSRRISGDDRRADHWRRVFEEHPEFFRLDSEEKKASLVWRRQHQRLFNVDTETIISKDEYQTLSERQRTRISRNPLTSTELATLLTTAIELHSRALDRKRDARWWLIPSFTLAGVVLGALIPILADWLSMIWRSH